MRQFVKSGQFIPAQIKDYGRGILARLVNAVVWLGVFLICIHDIRIAKKADFEHSILIGSKTSMAKVKVITGISGVVTAALIGYTIYLIPFAVGMQVSII